MRHALIVFVSSLIFYAMMVSEAVGYDSSRGTPGGLRGAAIIANAIVIVIAVLLVIFQAVLLLGIIWRERMSALNLFIALPLMLLIPLSLQAIGLPGRYTIGILVNLLLSGVAFHYVLLRNKPVEIGIACTHVALVLCLCLYWNALSSENPRWWDTGSNVVKYYDNGVKKSDAERMDRGVTFGDYRRYDPLGVILTYARYPNGSNEPADSTVEYYRDGSPKEIKYEKKIAGKRNKYKITFHTNGSVIEYERAYDGMRPFSLTMRFDPERKLLKHWEHQYDSAGRYYAHVINYDSTGGSKLDTIIQSTY